MGNCFALCKTIKNFCAGASASKHQKVLQVVKMDGKIFEFTEPIVVKDLLVNFVGLGVGASKKASQHLPPSYELMLGNVYYLLPLVGTVQTTVSPAGVSPPDKREQEGSVKRIKVVITKQQLQELLSKQISVQTVLSGLEKKTQLSGDSSISWRPNLESIPEGIEVNMTIENIKLVPFGRKIPDWLTLGTTGMFL
ncbi:unnamed protein product [Ilex paraguariensis]|uniref:Uncharacterized protein n=1 Tax=Ilex paraguariensis TaxID=185542 RepID=A0ABC8RQR3_9AQUA